METYMDMLKYVWVYTNYKMLCFVDTMMEIYNYMCSKTLKYVDTMIVIYNYARLRYLDWLELSGIKKIDGIRCIYYTHKGSRYLIPYPKQRGPSFRDPDLEDYFFYGINKPELMIQFMGPNNDWHLQTKVLKNQLGIV